MSATTDDPESGAARVSSGWLRIGAAAAIVCGIVLSFFFFSGSIPGMGFFEAPPAAQPTYDVTVNSAPTRVDRATPAFTAAPPRTSPQPRTSQPAAAPAWTKEQTASLDADMGGTFGKPSIASTAAKRDGKADEGDEGGDAFTKSLTHTELASSRMTEMGNPRWLISQGRLIKCTDATRMKSAIPGMVKATIDEDVRGDTGDVTLLPKGSEAVGVIRNAVMNGTDLLSVMWMNIKTPILYDDHDMPHRFRVGVDSPFASALGETGADGDVDHHWGRKIGAIIGASVFSTGSQYLIARAQPQNTSNTSVNLNQIQGGSESAMDEFLRAQIEIPDVMTRNQGKACAIFVARDLEISQSYKLYLLNKYGS